MLWVVNWINKVQDGLQYFNVFDFLVFLVFRLYLVFIFIVVGWYKLNYFSDIVDWFCYLLELLMFELMVFLVMFVELFGGFVLLVGVVVWWVVILLMIIMLVVVVFVYWDNGWFVIVFFDVDFSIVNVFVVIGFFGVE